MKKITIIIFTIISFLYFVIGIPSTVEGQIIASIISNIPILGYILTSIDTFSLFSILNSNLNNTGQFIKLLSILGSLFVTAFTIEKTSYFNNIIDFIADDDEDFKKYAKYIAGFFICLGYAIFINVFLLDGFLFKIINLTDKEMNNFQNTINQLETLN